MKLSTLKLGQRHRVQVKADWLPRTLEPAQKQLFPKVAKLLEFDINAAFGFCVALLEDVNANEEAKFLNTYFLKQIAAQQRDPSVVEPPKVAPKPLAPAEVNLKGKDFDLHATMKSFSARTGRGTPGEEVAIGGSNYGVRAYKAAYEYIVQNQDQIQNMTWHDFVSALYKATGKYPHTYSAWD